jgi:uncharacterized Tic20 family protein
MSIYDDLERLKRLLDSGAITPEEYEREKSRILASQYQVNNKDTWDMGIDENAFVALMHASQFITAFIIPLIVWILLRPKSRIVDEAGKNILNFEISFAVYSLVLLMTCVGSVLIPVLLLIMTVFIVIAIIKAINGETWEYPLSFRLLK